MRGPSNGLQAEQRHNHLKLKSVTALRVGGAESQ
jgi:hypothetical protein